MTAQRLHDTAAIEAAGEERFKVTPRPGPGPLRRSADLLSAALMQQDTGTEEREPAA